MSFDQLEHLRQQFEIVDTNKNYMINKEELMQAMANMGAGYELSEKDAEKIINELDTNQNDEINYLEFMSATVNLQDLLTEDKLDELMQMFDLDDNQ